MKHIIFRLLLTSVIVIVMIETSLINALFMLFVAGTVPGTNYVIPANIMMLGYSALICATLIRAVAHNLLRTYFTALMRALRSRNKSAATQAAQ